MWLEQSQLNVSYGLSTIRQPILQRADSCGYHGIIMNLERFLSFFSGSIHKTP